MRGERSKFIRAIEDCGHRLRHVLPVGGHRLHGDEHYAPFFIVSAGRSGTTLLRRMLCRHPDVFIPEETSLKPAIARFRRYNRMRWPELVSFTLAYYQFSRVESHATVALAPLVHELRKLPGKERTLARILDAFYRFETRSLRGSETARWGDKTPANIFAMDQIVEVFPDARFIHLYRDGCDVVHSLVAKGISADAESAAGRWVASVRSADRFKRGRRGVALMNLKYEEFVVEPEARMRELCSFIGLDYRPELLVEGPSESDSVGQLHSEISPLLSAKISTGTIGTGRRALDSGECGTLAPILDPWLERLGYQPCR